MSEDERGVGLKRRQDLGWQGLKGFLSQLDFSNYALLASDTLYLDSYLQSLRTAAFSTLILLLVGAFPRWGYNQNWGYGPSGGLGLVVTILLVLVLLGRI